MGTIFTSNENSAKDCIRHYQSTRFAVAKKAKAAVQTSSSRFLEARQLSSLDWNGNAPGMPVQLCVVFSQNVR